VIGGAIVGAWSWRGIFWFNLVFGLAALIAAAITVPESSDPTAARVDTWGTVFGAGALAALMFAIIDAETASFGSAEVIVLLCAAVILAAAFVAWERRAAHPLLDLRFFRMPQFTVPNIVAFCTYLATFAIFFFTALYLVEVPVDSGYMIAAVFAPMTVLMILGSLVAGYWTGRTGPRWPITVGCAAWPASASASRSSPSPPQCLTPCPLSGLAWPPRPPTPAGRSAPSPAPPSSAPWSSPGSTPP
jgi:predicted MFS family arabinose efflux permease